MRAPAGSTARTAPIPWPAPQMVDQALGFDDPSLKFIALAFAPARLSGSSPALRIDGAR